MNDWGLSVLSRYPVTVRGTKKVRGALLCDTTDGLFLLQEYHGSERRLLREAEILEFTAHRGGYLTDVIIPDEEGRLWNRNEEGNRYVLKRWYPYPECSAQSRSDVSQAVRLLARLHLLLRRVLLIRERRPGAVRAGKGRRAFFFYMKSIRGNCAALPRI